jgi:aerotaxis receptor
MAVATHLVDRETLVPENVFIYSRTDSKGRITEANSAFADLSGYAVEEMIGKPHNLVRHPDMPKQAFADMWRSLKAGRPWQGFVKNRRKDGGYYWVHVTVSPVRGENGQVVGFQSLRRRPPREQVKAAADAYRRIQKGDASLCIEEGRVLRTNSAWSRLFARPDLRLTAGAVLGLAASLTAMTLEFAGAHSVILKALAGAAFALGALGTAFLLLSTIPNLLRDLDNIDSHLDALISSGDFTTPFQFEGRGRSGKIAGKIELLTGWVQSTIQCTAIHAIGEAAVAENLATSSVAAATTELDLTIREVAQNLQTTESSVQESGRRATAGAEISQRAAGHIQELAEVVKSASVEVEALGTSSAEVGAIAGVIREIADQTNLLALNASIEAARAGDAGRGFAVVAHEVRSLADRTMKATAKIDALISTIKGDSDRAISGMRTGATQVTAGVALVQEAHGTLEGINTLMAEAVQRVSEIATSSSQQTEAINEISVNMTHVSTMTERNLSTVAQARQLMGDLTPMVDRVRQAVEQYRV